MIIAKEVEDTVNDEDGDFPFGRVAVFGSLGCGLGKRNDDFTKVG